MKKKLLPLILVLVCAVTCTFGLAACGGECKHDFQRTTLHEATCTEDAYYETKCTKCGEKGENSFYGKATGHGFTTAPVYNNDETCTTNGTQSRECYRCHEIITTEVPNSAKHIFNGTRDCERCDAQIENKYLKYELNTEGNGYIVSCDASIDPLKEYKDKEADYENMSIINIPAEHNGLPVVEIKDGGFSQNFADYAAQYMSVVYIPSTVKRIGDEAFKNSNLLKVFFEEGSQLETIGNYAFQYTKITELTLPEKVTTLAEYALSGMTYLTCVTLPQSLTQMGESVFSYDIRLNTIINNSELSMTQADIRTYFNYSDDINPRLAVREFNPNYIAVKTHTTNHVNQPFEVPVYFSYMHLDGENILTGFFVYNNIPLSGTAYFDKVEVPYGITQVDTIAFRNVTPQGDLALPNSVKKINKITKSYHFDNFNSTSYSKEIHISEYTDMSDFEESDCVDSNGVSHFKTYKDENPIFVFNYNFGDLWQSTAQSDYVYQKNGIKLTFTRSNETSLNGEGEVIEKTEDHPDSVFFGDTDILITIELANGVKYKIDSIMLEGHTTGPSSAAVTLRATYFDSETDMYVSGKSDDRSFTTQYNEFSFNGFNSGDYKTAEKWRFALWETNHQGNDKYSYDLRSLRITFDKKFNADLTEKAFA